VGGFGGGIAAAVMLALFLLIGANPARAEACPNEQLRAEDHSTSLPDCRAYEEVSPPFKDGQTVTFLAQDGIAVDDEALSYNSTGGFGEPGGDYGHPGTYYVARRGATGWSSTPVNLPGTLFQGVGVGNSSEVSDFSMDLGESLAIQSPVGSTAIDKRIYRVPVGGEPVEVGPTIEPARAATYSAQDVEQGDWPIPEYAGASANFDHVFFELENYDHGEQHNGELFDWFWSSDTTTPSRHSLYEYTGTGNGEPELVGVSNEGPVTHISEAHLISQCGIYSGSPNSSVNQLTESYNAVSESGDTVFFTALACGGSPATNEVYARVDRSQTVAISEPSKEDCSACDTSTEAQEAAPEGALFGGANQAGTRVFFLSAQNLFRGERGEAGDNLYEYDFEAPKGEKVSLVAPNIAPAGKSEGKPLPGGVARVSEDGSRVYLVSEDNELATNKDANGKTAAEEDRAGRGNLDLYAFSALSHRLVFVAALAAGDSEDWQFDDERPVQATANGGFVVFTSSHDLTPGAEGSYSQVYRYDAQSGEEEAQAGVASSKSLVRISIGQQSPGGYYCLSTKRIEAAFNCDGNQENSQIGGLRTGLDSYAHPQQNIISANGAIVFFTSHGGLTPQALNDRVIGCEVYEPSTHVCEVPSVANNVYEWEQAGIGSCPADESTGCVFLISDGQDINPTVGSGSAVELWGASPSGNDVFFTTADSLVGQDTDVTGQDVYDARVDGGFPAPAAPVECKGETCQAPVGLVPVFGAPASASFAGPGNLAPPPAVVTPKKKTAAEIRAEQLAKALKQCRKEKKKAKRMSCEKQARKKYGATKAKKSAKADRRASR
jgi:hypothetical protein